MIELKIEHPYNGNSQLIRHYAEDENGARYKVEQSTTGLLFDEAVDLYPTEHKYVVTDQRVETFEA